MKNISFPIIFCFSLLAVQAIHAQQITGVWKGKIDKKKVEVKIIQNGDSLTGTSYYYESEYNYRRYSIKGYFDQQTNSAVWWDDRLLEERTGKNLLNKPGKIPFLSRADFNCPGGGVMLLEGDAAHKENINKMAGPVDLEKITEGLFKDEWDFVIENYIAGTNDPYIIDSIDALSFTSVSVSEPLQEEKFEPASRQNSIPVQLKKTEPQQPELKQPVITKPLTIEEKFATRKKELASEIPITGEYIELQFYDNAEIDGDSISLFLNNKLIFEHIRLTGKPYTIKLPVSELEESNELTMVAENLGAIPPNTSYMLAIVGGKRYEAKLASTENSSAMIRFKK